MEWQYSLIKGGIRTDHSMRKRRGSVRIVPGKLCASLYTIVSLPNTLTTESYLLVRHLSFSSPDSEHCQIIMKHTRSDAIQYLLLRNAI